LDPSDHLAVARVDSSESKVQRVARSRSVAQWVPNGRGCAMKLKIGSEVKQALVLLAVALGSTSAAQVPGDWWPDPTTHRGLSVWLTYSRDYDAIYSNLDTDPKHEKLVQDQIAQLESEQIEVVFVALSSRTEQPHLQSLSDPESQVSRDLRYLLNQ